MSTEDADELMRAIKANYNYSQQPSEKSSSNAVVSDEGSPEKNTQRRSRIYLKNVECLREPRREPIEQQDNLISENFFHFDNDCNSMATMMDDPDFIGMLAEENMQNNNHNNSNEQNYNQNNNDNNISECRTNKTTNPSKQKISIKSVDVLREPALLRRDYEMQPFNTFMNTCNDLDNNINNDSDCNHLTNVDQFGYPTSNKPMLSANDSNIICPIDENVVNNPENFDKPRRPKIYIKNVDILKEPMSFTNNANSGNIQDSSAAINFNFLQPSLSQGAIPYLDTAENLSGSTPTVFDNATTLKQLPIGTLSEQYLFDSGSNNFIPSVNELPESFNYDNGPSNSSFLIENSRYGNGMDCSQINATHPSGSLPIMTEATPPPHSGLSMTIVSSTKSGEPSMDMTPPTLHPLPVPTQAPPIPTQTQKQKIFIKNVDILKEPQFQEQRGTLHLRTVDELNLMNKNEVQNLIAPNLDNTQTNEIIQEDELNENFNHLSTNATLPDMEEVVQAGETLYDENDTFKLQDFAAQGMHNWSDDYDLGEDISEIITDTIAPVDNLSSTPLQKSIPELDTPQMTIISIRDIEELTGEHAQPLNNAFECGDEVEQNSVLATIVDAPNANGPISNSAAAQVDVFTSITSALITPNCLKQERANEKLSGERNQPTICHVETSAASFSEIPPLTLMSTNSATPHLTTPTPTKASAVGCRDTLTASSLPVPPLVPMSPVIHMNTSGSKASTASSASASISPTSASVPVERGRIYVANNLMQSTPSAANTTSAPSIQGKPVKTPIAVSVTGGTSVRGRPFGSNRTGITKMRKQHDKATTVGIYIKCTVGGCAFRFKKPETLEYHLKCHNSNVNPPSPQAMLCPECKSTEFTNWNTLHTHLWRTHKVDMELYSCELCTFKTPIYSRLLNTHSKIHYEDRNYKCDQCEKAFKNTKQLKNHRRWHRNHATVATTVAKNTKENEKSVEEGAASTTGRIFYRCKDCDAVFSHRKSLREHGCKNADTPVQCEVCERVLSSKSSLKLHMQTHETTRRFKCNACDYTSNDHNAFRRHRMTHENTKMYKCTHCSYKSIQSVAYQKHIQQKHPEIADSVIYKCSVCHYATINHALYTVHCVKHENNNNVFSVADKSKAISTYTSHEASCVESLEQVLMNGNAVGVSGNESMTNTKIKVKSRLMLSLPDAPQEGNVVCTMTSPVQSVDIAIT